MDKTKPKPAVLVETTDSDDKLKKVSDLVYCQYQTVTVRRVKEEILTTTSISNVDDILKTLVPTKSFLYRNETRIKKQDKSPTSYVPMDVGKKPRRFFRFSYEYPNFDLKKFRFSKQENFNDRGYYSVKNPTAENKNINVKVYRNVEASTKYKSFSNTEDFNEIVLEDHFYEDLCYNDMGNKVDEKRRNSSSQINNIRTTAKVKIQEIFSSFKLPFFKKEDNSKKTSEDGKIEEISENNDSSSSMYDSVTLRPNEKSALEKPKPLVEEYLEPIQLQKDYCDVIFKEKDEGILGYIMNMFETRFGLRRESSDPNISEDSDAEKHPPNNVPSESVQKWNDPRKTKTGSGKSSMADRPLPVPVASEPYYMDVDRSEAEALLAGQPDGTFILRPSSQPEHLYTLSVACGGVVYNVGVRRRPDGRLALGFPRRGERSFNSMASLLRVHRRRRALLAAPGGVVAARLTEPPVHYQTPSSLPVVEQGDVE
ncbi:hypothetical protein JYU34_019132 [Plutella xylostella]|uniref:SH2 domain-containing protein n=1 Tax=Plutella xylostella TaxID=51655 RepID=A0ABQ7PWT7_PLUXY|nr:hypothetical protein JYU34_019132 [Plutella xylostella]